MIKEFSNALWVSRLCRLMKGCSRRMSPSLLNAKMTLRCRRLCSHYKKSRFKRCPFKCFTWGSRIRSGCPARKQMEASSRPRDLLFREFKNDCMGREPSSPRQRNTFLNLPRLRSWKSRGPKRIRWSFEYRRRIPRCENTF